MFCPNCGKSEQQPDSYCRSCGQFLTDFSGKSYLINKILGGNKPETQVNINLAINIVTTLASSLLLGFLNGYYDSLYEKTGQKAPTVIYLVYVFLGLVAAWQTLGFIVNSRLKKKLSARKKGEAPVDSSTNERAALSGSTQKSLPQADFDNVVPASIVEDTTKMLDKAPRKRS
ncbi:MAG TPA: hypothetical protein VJS44_05190 [Pyrinomonadaceae bacterium]|nr:hypothetical protein [Pyrinomonadaceae bacterium]